MFKLYDITPAEKSKTLPPDTYHAIAIAGDSLLGSVVADGHRVGPGSPLLLDGSRRSITLQSVFGADLAGERSARILAVTKACGLVAIPTVRAPRRFEWGSLAITSGYVAGAPSDVVGGQMVWGAGAGDQAFEAVISGRRHTSVKGSTSASGTIAIYGRYYPRSYDYRSVTLLAATAYAGSFSYEVGGTNEEEDFDAIRVVLNTAGNAVTDGVLVIDTFGELGR